MRERVSEVQLAGAHGPLTVALAEPAGSTQPGLLLSFGMSRGSALTEHPHSLTAHAFLDAGRGVLSFDLPCHGERVGAHGEGIAGMAAALLAGDDPFATFVADGMHVIDACLERGWNRGGPIVVCGVSRAGYCALRLAAEDRRVAAAAGLAPVTDWRALTEFAAGAGLPVVAGLALERWAPQLADRPVFLAIGNRDQRVGTASCIRFAEQLWAAAGA